MRVFMAPDYREGNPYQELLRRSLADAGVEVVFPTGYKRVLPLWRGLRSAGGHFDVLHLHWLSPFIKRGHPALIPLYVLRTIIDLLLCRCFLVSRIVWTVHNLASHENSSGGEHILRTFLARYATCVLVHSVAAGARVQTAFRCPQAKLQVVLHGEYREWYGQPLSQSEARQALSLPSEPRIFLFLGLIRPYKGLEALIQAWRALSPSNAILLIAGQPLDSAYMQSLQSIAAATPGIQFRSERIPDSLIPAFLSAADIFVLPLHHILTSGSLILAQSYGLPVVAPAYPFVVETLGTAGLPSLFPPESPTGLQEAIARSLFGNLVPSPSLGVPWSQVAAATVAVYTN